jgi:hypothetical protein
MNHLAVSVQSCNETCFSKNEVFFEHVMLGLKGPDFCQCSADQSDEFK